VVVPVRVPRWTVTTMCAHPSPSASDVADASKDAGDAAAVGLVDGGCELGGRAADLLEALQAPASIATPASRTIPLVRRRFLITLRIGRGGTSVESRCLCGRPVQIGPDRKRAFGRIARSVVGDHHDQLGKLTEADC
jgi:hypothetical protein